MTALAKIHVLKRDARLGDDDYRALLERETGKRSSKDMTGPERLKVISALERLAPGQSSSHAKATGAFARKLQALWIAGWNLGVVDDKSDKAMINWLKRQTGLDHHRFLQDPDDAGRAIDALKGWIRRVTGNDGLFRQDKTMPALYNDFRFQVCLHIWSELVKRNAAPAGTSTAYLTKLTGKADVPDLDAADWIAAQNELGKVLRAAK